MSLYIFLLCINYHLCFTCIDFYDLSAWGSCWFVVYIRMFIYNFLNVCPFDCTAVAGRGKIWSVNQVNHTSWVTVVTPTDRPKSVRNRGVSELFCCVVCVAGNRLRSGSSKPTLVDESFIHITQRRFPSANQLYLTSRNIIWCTKMRQNRPGPTSIQVENSRNIEILSFSKHIYFRHCVPQGRNIAMMRAKYCLQQGCNRLNC